MQHLWLSIFCVTVRRNENCLMGGYIIEGGRKRSELSPRFKRGNSNTYAHVAVATSEWISWRSKWSWKHCFQNPQFNPIAVLSPKLLPSLLPLERAHHVQIDI